VHAAEHVCAHTKQRRARIVVTEYHACCGEFPYKVVVEVGGAIAVEQHFDMYPTLGCTQDNGMQLAAHTVIEPDEGLKEHPTLRLINGSKDRRVKLIAIFQQLDPVTALP